MKKILVVSHNPFSDEDNMGRTLSNLFSGIKKENICQLYFHNQIPSFEICEDYYSIEETAILKSVFNRKLKTGNAVSKEKYVTIQKNDKNNTEGLKNAIYRHGRKRTQVIFFLRNIMWNLGKWKSESLMQWLQEQKPTCIFFCGGDYWFLYQIVLEISKDLDIPIFSYFVDEYYISKMKGQKIPCDAIVFRYWFRKIVKKSSMNFGISEALCEEYKKLFGKKFELLMNPYNYIHKTKKRNDTNEIHMCYYGNLTFNRWKNLSALATVISELNEKNKVKIKFDVYSAENDKEILSKLQDNKCVNFMGKVSPDELQEIIKRSDVLVHVEDFGDLYKDVVRYSISTKIPELLTSQRLILCIGPLDIEPIAYLDRNNAAVVVDDVTKIKQALEQIYDWNYENNERIISNALMLANKNHTQEKNNKILSTYLLER